MANGNGNGLSSWFDKRISWGHLASILIFIISVSVAWAKLEAHIEEDAHPVTEARLDQLELKTSRLEEKEIAIETRLEDMQDAIISRLDRIERQLDAYDAR